MANAVVLSHQARDPEFNQKAPNYKTAVFSDAAIEMEPGRLPCSAVRVVFMAEQFNAHYGETEPVFAVYRNRHPHSLVGTYFARALKDFCL